MTGFVAKRRGNRRRYAIALGLGFHPATLALLVNAARTGMIMVGDGQACRTLRQALAIAPRGCGLYVVPAHRELVTPAGLYTSAC